MAIGVQTRVQMQVRGAPSAQADADDMAVGVFANMGTTHFENSDRDAVIVSSCRTPIGKLRGGLAEVRPDDLLALAYREAVARARIQPEWLDETFAGCANQAGEDNRNISRMASLLAGFPDAIPGVTVNRLCASGLEAVVQASRGIRLGDYACSLAGGVESMTRAPWSMAKPAVGFPTGAPSAYDTALGWRYPNPKMAELFPLEQMGETAENLVDRHNISREDQDRFACESHQKALRAQEAGFFGAELCPVEIPQRKGPSLWLEQDEGPRADTTLAKLATLKPAFRKGGSVTAGNSSTLNDGAAALVLTSRAFAEKNALTIHATLRAAASAGVSPQTMGYGPVPATQKLLAKTGLRVEELDAVELNEAFAAQALAVIRGLGLDESKVNLHGGAIALGHPLGCSGARILTTLLHVLKRIDGRLGLATLCVGVGQGLSVLIEKENNA